jgi:hypothetical protein
MATTATLDCHLDLAPIATAKTMPMTKPRIGTVKKPTPAAGMGSRSRSGKRKSVKK